jgi:hypothetical protein
MPLFKKVNFRLSEGEEEESIEDPHPPNDQNSEYTITV